MLANRERGATLKSQAMLFRASHHSAALELELARRNIPFVKFGGLKFLDAAHVKDALALLRFAENPRDRVAGSASRNFCPASGRRSRKRLSPRRLPMTALRRWRAGSACESPRRLFPLRGPHAPPRRPRRALARGACGRGGVALAAPRDALRRRAPFA